ncbi:YoaK family protein [Leifsonia aquatica]|uniref:YoaK family protein n=1 Tax=Leifsonia aquatica TaxID=144185 RepID=UPI0028AD224B|nr:DUF1275 family protein [Leifsonia aquatica]
MVRSLSRRNFAAAAALAALAGFVDGFGFSYLGGFFVSFMSGNTTRVSVDLVGGMWGAALTCAVLIVAFVGGTMIGTVVSATRHGATRVLVLIAVALAAAALVAQAGLPVLVGAALSGGMGAANTVMARGGEVSFGITYMTGALVKVGQGLVAAWRGGDRTGWVRHVVMWASIASGAVAGAAAFRLFGVGALWIAVAVVVITASTPRLRRWLHS